MRTSDGSSGVCSSDLKLAGGRTLPTDRGDRFDRTVRLDAAQIAPNVTWGTSPEDVAPITATIPDPESFADPARQAAARQSLDYMGLAAGTALRDVPVQHIFIGSCTHSRIENLRAAAAVVRRRRVAEGIRQALGVPAHGRLNPQTR